MGILYLYQMKIAYELLALQLDPNRRAGVGRWMMDGGVEEEDGGTEEGRRKLGRGGRREAERTKEQRKEGVSESRSEEGRESALRTGRGIRAVEFP